MILNPQTLKIIIKFMKHAKRFSVLIFHPDGQGVILKFSSKISSGETRENA